MSTAVLLTVENNEMLIFARNGLAIPEIPVAINEEVVAHIRHIESNLYEVERYEEDSTWEEIVAFVAHSLFKIATTIYICADQYIRAASGGGELVRLSKDEFLPQFDITH